MKMVRLHRLYLLGLLLLAGWIFATAVQASETEEHVSAIQERLFQRDHEIGLLLGYLSNSDFYHVYPIGINYTFHYNEYIAWEVARVQYMLNQEKDLKSDLEKNFGATPSQFSEPKYMLHSHFVLKPLYGKDALWNSGIINRETYFFLGGGIVNYEKQYSWGEPDNETALSVSFGLGTRYFLSENVCLHFEIRDLVNMKEEKTENNLSFGFALSYQFNLSPRKAVQDESVKKMKKYLGENESYDQ